jgi:drug/metabolite transporter (DMT)-like permease
LIGAGKDDMEAAGIPMTDPEDGGLRSGPAAAGIALAVLSAGTFGTSGIFASALISAGWSPAAAAIARLGGAAFLLAIPAMVQLRGRWALLRREAGKVMVYGLVAMAGGQLFYFNAIESIPIGLAVLLEYLGVVLVVGWLWAIRGQRPGRLTVAGVVTAIAGLALLVGMAGSARLSPAGITWGLLEAVSLAVSFLLAAATGETVLPPLVMAWAGLGIATAFLAVAGETGVLHVTATAGGVEIVHRRVSWVVPVLELSLVSTAIAYVAGIAAARRLGAKLASFTGMAEVFFAALYAWLLLGQLPSPIEFTGGALMLAGVILVRVDENQPWQPRSESARPVSTWDRCRRRGR